MINLGQFALATLVVGGGVTLGVYFHSFYKNKQIGNSSEVVTLKEKTPEIKEDHLQSLSVVSQPSSSKEKEVIEEIKPTNTQSGNCQVIQFPENILPFNKSKRDYYAISCKNKGIKIAQDEVFFERWEGLFPKKLFKKNNLLSKNQQFEIKIESDTEIEQDLKEDWYLITLSSPEFKKTEMIGKWSYQNFKDKYGVLIKVPTKPTRDIYLLLQQGENTAIKQVSN